MRLAIPSVLLGCLAAACGDDTSSADAAPRPDAAPQVGRFTLSWTISDGDAPLSCADVNASTLSVVAVQEGAGFGMVDALACSAGSGETRLLEAATYDVSVELVAFEGSLAEPVSIANATITAGADTPLGEIAFTVVPRGGFRFQIDTAAAIGNCAPAGDGGGGVTEMLVELRDADGACLPTDFVIDGADTYASNCTGARHACIENDAVLEATNRPAGELTLFVTAYRGDLACYASAAPVDIPGGNLVTSTGTVHLALDAELCPE